MEQAEHHNIPLSIVINWCTAILKGRTIAVTIINTNRYNVWNRQPLLAAKLYDVECTKNEYSETIDWEGENITTEFQPVPPQLIDTNSCQVEARPTQPTSPQIEKPGFGPRLDINATDFNFKNETDQLPFQLNIKKEANLM